MSVLNDLRDKAAEVSGLTEYRDERAAEVQADAGGWFPKADAGARHTTEFLLENPNFSVREQTASYLDESIPDSSKPKDVAWAAYQASNPAAPLMGSRESFQEEVDDAELDEKQENAGFLGSIALGEAERFTNLGTGVNFDGERDTTGIDEATTPLWYLGGPLTRGVGVATRGGARSISKMANTGTLQSARQSMKRAATYMPERLAPIGGAPARSVGQKGVKGASGSMVQAVDDATVAVGKRLDAVPFGRTGVSLGGAAGGLGAIGGDIGGGARAGDSYSYEVADRMSDPTAVIYDIRDADTSLGYLVVLGGGASDGSNVTIITPSGGARSVTFPARPNFHSIDQARNAYQKFNREANDPASPSGGLMDMGSEEPGADTWDQPNHARRLKAGWHLYEQEHRTEDRTRYIVAAVGNDSRLRYLDGDAQSHTSFAAFKDRENAFAALDRWVGEKNAGSVPEADQPNPDADRPAPVDVGGTNQTGVLGMSVPTSTIKRLSGIAVALAIGYYLYGRL